jgi:hypothetical protein
LADLISVWPFLSLRALAATHELEFTYQRFIVPSKMRHLAIAVLTMVAVGCDKPSPVAPTSSADVRINGRVLDYASGNPIPGATVTFDNSLSVPSDAPRIVTAVGDATGGYTALIPAGYYQTFVDGQWVGYLHLTSSPYRGDFFGRWGTCVARYGIITDAQTHRPIPGAAVSIVGSVSGNTVTGSDGWYRLEFGCPTDGRIGFNTTILGAVHPAYAPGSASVGRGISGVSRIDVELQPR